MYKHRYKFLILILGLLITACSNGRQLWRFETNNAVFASPAIGADGTIYIGAGTRVFAIKDDNGGLSSTAPWPMFRRDAQHSGND